jgi:hypothetical protein
VLLRVLLHRCATGASPIRPPRTPLTVCRLHGRRTVLATVTEPANDLGRIRCVRPMMHTMVCDLSARDEAERSASVTTVRRRVPGMCTKSVRVYLSVLGCTVEYGSDLGLYRHPTPMYYNVV